MSDLKEKVHEIRPGHLEWVYAQPFLYVPILQFFLNEKKLTPSKSKIRACSRAGY